MSMQMIDKFLEENIRNQRCIHVIGDALLDEYYSVKITRISPESSNIKVLQAETDRPYSSLPGGAGNVCSQISAFNAKTRLFSIIGEEAARHFERAGIKNWGILPCNAYIPRKKRFFDGDIQVSDRWDIEKTNYGLGDLRPLQESLTTGWQNFRKEPDVVILSDYNKGLFHDLGLKDFNFPKILPTIIDPKKPPISRWEGCHIFKPNKTEAVELSCGLTSWKDQCDFFQDKLGCKAVVITQESNGIVGKTTEHFEHRPTKPVIARRIFGAGDCFIAILALCISHKFSVEESAKIAFEASSIYVQSQGNITPAMLKSNH